MITFTSKGDFKKANSWFEKMKEIIKLGELNKYGRIGVEALRSATPKESGETADSWSYEIVRKDGETKIVWTNSHINKGVNIAVILQYGHGTGTGGYVEGIDYINPAMKPVFQEIVDNALKEVTS
jgi:hypothetical protein